MKAIVQDTYGSTDVLELRDIDKPETADGEVLLRVHAAGVDRGVRQRPDRGHTSDRRASSAQMAPSSHPAIWLSGLHRRCQPSQVCEVSR